MKKMKLEMEGGGCQRPWVSEDPLHEAPRVRPAQLPFCGRPQSTSANNTVFVAVFTPLFECSIGVGLYYGTKIKIPSVLEHRELVNKSAKR